MAPKGFTLIEVVLAVVLLSFAAVGLGQFMARYQRLTANATLVAAMTSIAKERIELIRSDPRYPTLVARYGTGPSADTTGFPGYPSLRRQTVVARDRTGSPPRDRTTVTVRVFAETGTAPDTVSFTTVVALP